ncbi:uncharacterized protein CELE_Y47G6A.26 [Caenorhabditis elegans]|uniref:Uncharacterized protein n=1 Tax=Caenorhabditis elegans TaxID=6239 RepID=Q9N3R3_CAEEL|nr:Uncharacterized protein CELE_Y47G6A.26 [Caenorhabditis elegans]CCD72571.1 Uncharacterized protein CELE_Y47G6A.26 [Caenorhabditis elegans]|eukprot:NP_491188.1 Uncharacterized protein CELE_Y47G6A.26 [Caenorhabditis elegans]
MADQYTRRVPRPRSTLVPGRRMTEMMMLHEAGIDETLSYLDEPSQVSTRNSNTAIQAFPVMNGIRDSTDEHPMRSPAMSSEGSPRNRSGRDVEVQDDDVFVPSMASTPISKKSKLHPNLAKSKLVDHSCSRPKRNRIPPLRYWIGERPLYRYDQNFCREFVGISEAFSPKSLENAEKEERKARTKRSKKSRKRKRT